MCRALSLVCAIWPVVALHAPSARASDFYAGKTIRLIVGSEVGGGFDIYGRAIGRHIGRLIPGSPTVIVQNIPGAGGGKAASYLYSVAPKDGTIIGGLLPGTILNPLLDGNTSLYDPSRFAYIGTADSGTRLCVTSRTSSIKTFDDAIRSQSALGATAAGSSMFDYAYLLRNIARAQFRVIGGYKNTAEIALAMERGEVDGVCGWDWSSLRSQQPDYGAKFNIIVQTGMKPNPDLDKLGVRMIQDYVRNDDDRAVLELFLAQQIFGRPYVVPPDTPEQQTEILRRAFDETMSDPRFLDDVNKNKLQISAAPGTLVQGVVAGIYATPKHILDRAKDVIKP
jgi:tripartite-type tricarboxylate transporter receptor subunit TctC